MADEERSYDFQIAVPSRGRVRFFYLKSFRKIIYRFSLEKETTVFVQTEEDLQAYSAAFPTLKILLTPGEGQAAAQEAIRKHYPVGTRVVVLHDDVTRVVRLRDGSFRRFEDVRRLFRVVFELMERYGVALGGLAPTTNGLYEAYTPRKVSLCLRFIYDPLHFELVQETPFVPKSVGKHDFERSIESYRAHGGVLRLSGFSFSTARGLSKRALAQDEADCALLMSLYPKEISYLQKHRGGYSSLVLRSLPYEGRGLLQATSATEAEQEAQSLFHEKMGNFDVELDLQTPGGRLLSLLQKHPWRPNRLRASVVAPELREDCVSKKGNKTVKATVAVFSASFSEGPLFEACVTALPPWAQGRFDFVTLNKNICCYPHRDAGNAGPSVALFLGKYEGGALCTEAGQRFEAAGVLRVFDGSRLHWNEPVTGGCKYSVIFYNKASGRLRAHAPQVAPPKERPPEGAGLQEDAVWGLDGLQVPFSTGGSC